MLTRHLILILFCHFYFYWWFYLFIIFFFVIRSACLIIFVISLFSSICPRPRNLLIFICVFHVTIRIILVCVFSGNLFVIFLAIFNVLLAKLVFSRIAFDYSLIFYADSLLITNNLCLGSSDLVIISIWFNFSIVIFARFIIFSWDRSSADIAISNSWQIIIVVEFFIKVFFFFIIVSV